MIEVSYAVEAFKKYYRETWEEEFDSNDISQIVKREVFIAGYLAALGLKEEASE